MDSNRVYSDCVGETEERDMNEIRTFRCGLCKPYKAYVGTRKGLREHLKREHRILNEITNSFMDKKRKRWWIIVEKDVAT